LLRRLVLIIFIIKNTHSAALALSCDLCFRKVILEGNALKVVQALNNEVIDWRKYGQSIYIPTENLPGYLVQINA